MPYVRNYIHNWGEICQANPFGEAAIIIVPPPNQPHDGVVRAADQPSARVSRNSHSACYPLLRRLPVVRRAVTPRACRRRILSNCPFAPKLAINSLQTRDIGGESQRIPTRPSKAIYFSVAPNISLSLNCDILGPTESRNSYNILPLGNGANGAIVEFHLAIAGFYAHTSECKRWS